MPSTQVTKRNKILFVDYKPFHKKRTNFSKNKLHYTIYNFQGFQVLGFSIVTVTTNLCQGFKDFFKGTKENQERFIGFKKFRGR